MKKLIIVFAMAFILIGVTRGHAQKFEPGNVRYDSRTFMLDPNLAKTESYYKSHEFSEEWKKATARPNDDAAEFLLWNRIFPASASLQKAQSDSLRI